MSIDIDLSGKVVAVTGGSRGIGKAIAEALLRTGASVAINGRNEEKGHQTIKEIGEDQPIIFIKGDVRKQSEVENFIAKTIEKFGQIDILINNAGGSGGFAPVSELTDEAWENAAAWILHSTFWATRAALRDMNQRGWGRIINISSVEGRQANKENVAHYITFKHAMNGFTKAVAFENGAKGITCNAISPGAVETDLMMEQGPAAAESMGISYEEFKQNYAQESSIKRLNTTDEVSGLAVFLCSKLGSGITGAILPVDGGTSL
tara:strand:+ start:132 stop:920 length:789 start_codon:yes stop_codon:yes gene_type:complete